MRRWKRFAAIGLSCALLCMALSGCAGKKDDFIVPTRVLLSETETTFGNFGYVFYDDDTVGIASYKGSESRVIVPDTIEGKRVVSVEYAAFMGCVSVRAVHLGKYVEVIGDDAFYGCTALTEINIPDKVWSIGTSAFGETPWLQAQTDEFVIVGDGVLLLYQGKAGTVTVPDKVKHLSCAFGLNTELYSVTMGDNVRTIGRYAFAYCESLREVVIGENVVMIGDNAFDNCMYLTHINIPDKVESIGDYAFYYCNYLSDAYIGNSVTSIGRNAFTNCMRMRTLRLPASLGQIGQNAFEDCVSLTVVFYQGDETAYSALEIGSTNYLLSDAHTIYSYGGGAR